MEQPNQNQIDSPSVAPAANHALVHQRGVARETFDAFLARPRARPRFALIVQLGAIVLWNTVLLVTLSGASDAVTSFWRDVFEFLNLRPYWSTNVVVNHEFALLGGFDPYGLIEFSPLFILGQLVVAFVPFRAVNRKMKRPLIPFVRSWYQACLWGTAILLPGLMLSSLLQSFDDWLFWFPVVTYFAIAPSLLSYFGSRPRWRMVRWRPECPECGYALRKLAEARCPECGVAFPTSRRVYRRWAFRRIMWDRVQRDSFLFAYIRTMPTIVLCPCRAARGLVIPDRMGRAWRWAIGHVLIAAFVCAAIGSNSGFLQICQSWVLEDPSWFAKVYQIQCFSSTDVAVWFFQSFAAWIIALACIPVLGIVLLRLWPIRHRMLEAGVMKASLYLTAILPWSVLISRLIVVVRAKPPTWMPLWQRWFVPPPSILSLVVVYGFLWSAICGSHTYRRERGIKLILIHWTLFVATWLLLARVIVDPGPLEWIL